MKAGLEKISIVICTYNREYILRDCLDSLVAQTADTSLFEVIVVNNNSSDKTLEIADEYSQNHPNFSVVTEVNQGLSHARNRGYKESKYNWVAYVDDDAKAFPTLVKRAIETIEKYGFDCVGGMYYPWYRGTVRPNWLSENFGKSIKYATTVVPLTNGYISGGVCLFKKAVIESIGGFPFDLGMNGTSIAYGEETYVQNKLVENGFSIGFDPEFCIHHLVPDYKQKVNWHIKSAYANGRDSVKIWNYTANFSFFQFIKSLVKILIKKTPRAIGKFISKRNYYYENLYLDILTPVVNLLGYYLAINKKTNHES